MITNVGARSIRLAFISILLFSGCAARVTSIDDGQPSELSEDMGYLVLAIDERSQFQSIMMSGEARVRISSDSLIEGSNYIVYPLEAGDYYFDSFYVTSSFKIRLDEDNWSVRIEPNRLTYVGHINVSILGLFSSSAVKLSNRSSEALAFLEDSYPQLLNEVDVAYGGPGNDAYLEYVLAQKYPDRAQGAATNATSVLEVSE
ncbi:MAG: hypothetical protein ABNH02_03835 [Pseudomonadales bacterium]|jgi:hypothetical protein